MHRRLVALGSVSLLALATFCGKPYAVRRVVTAEAEILSVNNEYTIVILSPAFLVNTFGPNWYQLNLFYGSNRATNDHGERGALASSPLRPLAKGSPILVFPGDQWSDLIVPVYALETRQQATLAIDTTKGSVGVLSPAKARGGVPEVSANGRLLLR